MIFGKDKKNSTADSKNSVEDSAIDRWRTLNDTPNTSVKPMDTESKSTNFKRTSYLSSLISDDARNTSTAAETVKHSISENEESQNSFIEQDEFLNDEVDDNSTVLNLETVLEEEFDEVEMEEEPIEEISPIMESTPPKQIKERISGGDFSISIEDDLTNRFGSNLKSALGEGTMIDGVFSFESPVKVDGTLSGEIRSESALIVGKKAKIKARIKVGSLVVIGNVEGEIEAEDLVEIRSTGSVNGDIITKRIALEEGGILNGSCTILD